MSKYNIYDSKTGEFILATDLNEAEVEALSGESAEGHFQASRCTGLEQLAGRTVFATVDSDSKEAAAKAWADEHNMHYEVTPPAKSWAVEVIADNSGKWVGNGLRFADRAMAEAWAAGLADRWTAVREWRVVTSQDEPNRPLVSGGGR